MQEQVLDHQEIEWQLEAVDLALVENWLEEYPTAAGLAVVPGWASELADVYYDTDDWRFYRAGYALRLRRNGESAQATMKARVPAEGGIRRRREISEPIEGIENLKGIAGPVGERVRRVAGTADLRPLFEVRTRRRTFALGTETPSSEEIVVDGTGNIRQQNSEQDATVAEIALDESEIFANGGAKTHLSRVEVEVGSDAAINDGVGDFVEVLKEALKLRPTRTSKFRTGLSVAGLIPAVAPDLGPTKIDSNLSVGQVAFAILRRHFRAMVAHEPGVRLGENPEELHDMRVATRRLRAALKLYSDFLPKRSERYERDLRWVAGALGEVRDLDVHLEELSEESSKNGEVLEEVLPSLLRERRVEARRRMLQALDSNRYERLIASFSGTLRRGRSPSPTGSILEAAPDLLRDRYKKVRKAANKLREDSPPEHFHELRKKGKRLRYALEPLQEIYGKPAKKMVKLLKKTQDDLGDHQDLIVAAGLMEELGVAGDRPPQAAFSMGSMAERYGCEATEIRAGFLGSKPLRNLKRGKPWRNLRKKLEKRAGG